MVSSLCIFLKINVSIFNYFFLYPDIVFGENMQLMPINRPSTIYINSDEALVNVNVAVMGMLPSYKSKA